MTFLKGPAVVVGYDGSATAQAALLFAAGEAARRGTALRIAYAQELGVLATRDPEDLLHEARQLVRPLLPSSHVLARVRDGAAARVLTEESVGAELLVVGRGGLKTLGAVAGSVAIDAICLARCPVVVVGERRGRTAHEGAVVAGIDPEHCEAVLAAGFREAKLRHKDLIVLHACGGLHRTGTGYLGSCQDATDQPAALSELLRPFQAEYPSVSVTEICRSGRPRRVLNAASMAASLLVVGTRGRGPIAGLLLGSVGQTLVRQADCPIMIVRDAPGNVAPAPADDRAARGLVALPL